MTTHYEKQKQEAAKKYVKQSVANCIDGFTAFKSGCDHEHDRAKVLVKALQNIASTKKSDLMENPAYWGQMIVGEAMQALSDFESKGFKC